MRKLLHVAFMHGEKKKTIPTRSIIQFGNGQMCCILMFRRRALVWLCVWYPMLILNVHKFVIRILIFSVLHRNEMVLKATYVGC